MKWGGENETHRTTPTFRQRMNSYVKKLLGTERIARKVDEVLSTEVEIIDKQLLAGRNLACYIDAFGKLGLIERWEQDLFARRLVIQLGRIAVDDTTQNRIGNLTAGLNDRYKITHIRAIDDAARQVSLAVAGGLEDKQLPSNKAYLTTRIIDLLKLAAETRNSQPSKKLYTPSAETAQALEEIFEREKTNIAQLRQNYSSDQPAA
ncbi:hypothetical protein HYU95_03225 [Candidatus Daviesbacteria bacterium]|nr:hypothetical protein [Candidatus Daviesbacteria bacterium]